MRKLTPQDADSCQEAKLYLSGKSVKEVAAAVGKTHQAVWMILKRRSVPMRPQEQVGPENVFYRGGESDRKIVHDLMKLAFGNGSMKKETVCSACGIENPRYRDGRSAMHAHHDDYNKPFSVRWLCNKCHYAWHKTHKPVPRRRDEDSFVSNDRPVCRDPGAGQSLQPEHSAGCPGDGS